MPKLKKQLSENLLKIAILFCCAIAFACKLGPKFSNQNQEIVKEFSAKENFINSSQDIVILDETKNWWQTIDDKTFQKYLKELLQNNYSIQEAMQRALQAEQNYKIEFGSFFPSITIDSGMARSITPSNSLSFTNGGSRKFYNTNYSTKANVSWQLDFFGKIRNLNDKAKSEFVATKFDIDALQQSLIADLFKSRVAVAVNNELFILAKKNEIDKKNIYNLVKRRYESGANGINLSSLNTAKNNLNTAKNEALAINQQLIAEIYNFQSLLGKFPDEKQIDLNEFKIPKLPEKIETCIPAKLLDRRPDLKALELRLMSANSDVGVAIADLFPDFTISASTGFSGNQSKNLFDTKQLASSISGNIATKIFQGGKLKANVALKKAKFKELSANYANQIIIALKEVETFLRNEEQLKSEVNNQIESNKMILSLVSISQNRYENGVEKLENFLTAKEKEYNSKKLLLSKAQEQWNNRIDLYLSLGGDVSREYMNCKIDNGRK